MNMGSEAAELRTEEACKAVEAAEKEPKAAKLQEELEQPEIKTLSREYRSREVLRLREPIVDSLLSITCSPYIIS